MRGLALWIVCGALLCRVVAVSVSWLRVAGRWLGYVGVSCCRLWVLVVAPPLAVVSALGRFPCCACVSVGGRLSVSFLLFRGVLLLLYLRAFGGCL